VTLTLVHDAAAPHGRCAECTAPLEQRASGWCPRCDAAVFTREDLEQLRASARARGYRAPMTDPMGFEISAGVHGDADTLTDDVIDFAEATGLRVGGGIDRAGLLDMFVTRAAGDATEADREAVGVWLRSRRDLADVHVGPLARD
jgi:YggL 50S ribosome-binding protein